MICHLLNLLSAINFHFDNWGPLRHSTPPPPPPLVTVHCYEINVIHARLNTRVAFSCVGGLSRLATSQRYCDEITQCSWPRLNVQRNTHHHHHHQHHNHLRFVPYSSCPLTTIPYMLLDSYIIIVERDEINICDDVLSKYYLEYIIIKIC